MEKIIMVTTDYVPNKEIESCYGYISISLVEGANFLADLGAGVRDVFGGIADGYSKILERLKVMAIEGLENKARLCGVDAVLNVKVDMEPIFGSGYSMFMITATGTGVKLVNENIKAIDKEDKEGNIVNILENLYKEYKEDNEDKTKILNMKSYILEEYLAKKEIEDAMPVLKNLLKEINGEINLNKKVDRLNIEILKSFFVNNDYENIKEFLNTDITKEKASLIRLFGFVDYKLIKKEFEKSVIENEIYLIWILDTKVKFINKKEYESLKELLALLKDKYNGDVTIKKSTFSKKETWLCKNCGVGVDIERETCHMCYSSKYGIKLQLTENGSLISIKRRLNFLNDMIDRLKGIYIK